LVSGAKPAKNSGFPKRESPGEMLGCVAQSRKPDEGLAVEPVLGALRPILRSRTLAVSGTYAFGWRRLPSQFEHR
ncbi:hypothetical protein, partial [Mesorhizobium sp. M5C.F.Ca.ET.164.01.1.1]|uniref:hypothetical protein n=1 Tax=Mesorhizobium sp. M5C.F.Ca.ET.164.01.1.1 TaxID=2563957 RepID=UPI001AEE6B2C